MRGTRESIPDRYPGTRRQDVDLSRFAGYTAPTIKDARLHSIIRNRKGKQTMAKIHFKAAGLVAATLAAIGGSVLSAPGASASSPAPAGAQVSPSTTASSRAAAALGDLFLVNNKSGKCLTPEGGRSDNNAVNVIFNCDTDPSRVWYLVNKGNNIYQILNLNSGKCLTPEGGRSDNNAQTVIYNCDNDPSRLWYFVDKGNYRYHLVNYNSGKCLSPAGGGVLNNTPTVIYNCDTDPSRLWYLAAA
ncbi:RICIN domain-containing protein [Streptomyces sp. NPDC056835]|uniref:RICIN domain-containing protein n=1 Tax=Streptomyces sp. NPDC056835 TaxID=3345956 RepID=UPI00369AD282